MNLPPPQAVAVFLCGGSGTRMRGYIADKIFAPLNGLPSLSYTLQAFEKSGLFSQAIFVFRDEEQRIEIDALARNVAPNLAAQSLFCIGGAERKDSVFNGLTTAKQAGVDPRALVFIHDCARPLITAEALTTLAQIAAREGGAVLAHRCKNTIKRLPSGTPPGIACATEDLNRSRLWEMETPQVFPLRKIHDAYQTILRENRFVTDDVSAAAAIGVPVAIVENLDPNPKLTVPEDLIFCEALLQRRASLKIF